MAWSGLHSSHEWDEAYHDILKSWISCSHKFGSNQQQCYPNCINCCRQGVITHWKRKRGWALKRVDRKHEGKLRKVYIYIPTNHTAGFIQWVGSTWMEKRNKRWRNQTSVVKCKQAAVWHVCSLVLFRCLAYSDPHQTLGLCYHLSCSDSFP